MARSAPVARGGWEFFPGLPLRLLLSATYVYLSEGRDADQQADLDDKLGIFDDEPEEEPVDIGPERSDDLRARLAMMGDVIPVP